MNAASNFDAAERTLGLIAALSTGFAVGRGCNAPMKATSEMSVLFEDSGWASDGQHRGEGL